MSGVADMFSTIFPYGIILIVVFVGVSFVLEIAYVQFARSVFRKARERNTVIAFARNKKSRSSKRTAKDDKD